MTFTILTAAAGPRDVEAVEVEPGLYLHQLPDDVNLGDPRRWRISHHSGYAIAAARRRADAIAGARYLAGLADWTASVDALKSSIDDTKQMYVDLVELGCGHPEAVPRSEH